MLPIVTARMHAAVQAADDWALSCEAWHLLPSRGVEWVSAGLWKPGDAKPLLWCSWRRARRRYLRMHRTLVAAARTPTK